MRRALLSVNLFGTLQILDSLGGEYSPAVPAMLN